MQRSVIWFLSAALAFSTLTACTTAGQPTSTVTTAVSVTQTSVSYNADSHIYTLSWNAGVPVSIAVSQTADGSNSRLLAEKISSGMFLWQGPETEQRQFFIITPENSPAIITASRLLPVEGALNLRDLGGYKTADGHTVRWGKIYRSSMLAHLTADDYRLLTPLHIGTIADLRANEERAKDVTNWQAGEVTRIETDYSMDYSQFAGMMKEMDAAKAKAMFTTMYPGILQQQTANFRNMFRQLLHDDDALLFHCSAGKDRTGMAAMLVLTALGVPQETIMQDYLLSNTYYAANIASFSQQHSDGKQDATSAMMSRLPPEVSAVFMGVSPEYLQAAMDSMSAEHGSVMGYLQQELGLSDDDIATLRSRLLM